MGSLYLLDLARWLRDAGLGVIEYSGWQNRARGSGGYDVWPLCVMWHHTASPKSWDGQKDADYIALGDEDAPLANLYIERDGTVWVLAGGATNTNGKGNSITFSRGTVPSDSMNSRALGIEMGNDGIGELWPRAQIDSAFIVSNICNARFGNLPSDISTHNFYAPDRKIDPATTNVEGPWKPRSCNASGSWDRNSVIEECLKRAGQQPQPPTSEDDDVEKYCVRDTRGFPWVTDYASYATGITEDQAARGRDEYGYRVDSNGGPIQLDEQDTDLMLRISGQS